jgi:hypothetical protein
LTCASKPSAPSLFSPVTSSPPCTIYASTAALTLGSRNSTDYLNGRSPTQHTNPRQPKNGRFPKNKYTFTQPGHTSGFTPRPSCSSPLNSVNIPTLLTKVRLLHLPTDHTPIHAKGSQIHTLLGLIIAIIYIESSSLVYDHTNKTFNDFPTPFLCIIFQ